MIDTSDTVDLEPKSKKLSFATIGKIPALLKRFEPQRKMARKSNLSDETAPNFFPHLQEALDFSQVRERILRLWCRCYKTLYVRNL